MNCNVIRDLLPLYVDGVLSVESEEMVREHIETCKPCADILSRLQSKIVDVHTIQEVDSAKAIRAFGTAMSRRIKWRVVLAVVLTFVVIGLGRFTYEKLCLEDVIPVPASMVTSHGVTQTTDGRVLIGYALNQKLRSGPSYTQRIEEENGQMVLRLIPLMPRIILPSWISTNNVHANMSYPAEVPAMLSDDAMRVKWDYSAKDPDNNKEIVKIYLGEDDDEILIWQQGDPVPQCSSEVEATVQRWHTDDYMWDDSYDPGDWSTSQPAAETSGW